MGSYAAYQWGFWARLHSDFVIGSCIAEFMAARELRSPGVDLLRWPPVVGCWPQAQASVHEEASMLGFRSSSACQCKAFAHLQHARQSFCLSIAIFAVHSAFPAKSVSAFPPGADSHSRPLVEISVPAHWPD